MKKAKSILVTGGAGFIGSHVVERLLGLGKSVVVLDNFSDFYDPAVKKRNIEPFIKNKNCHFLKLDITDQNRLENGLQDFEISKIIHLAAQPGVRFSVGHPEITLKNNVLGTANILEITRTKGVQQFLFASSSSVYGDSKEIPFVEEKLGVQLSPYAVSKRSAELLVQNYSRLYRIPAIGFRFFTVYGERGRPDMAPYLFLDKIDQGEPITIFGDGTTMRDYTYIGDIVDGIVSALDQKFTFEIFNLGFGHPVLLKDFVKVIEKTTGKKAKIVRSPLQKADLENTFASINHAERLLNYKPKTDIESGMNRFYDWYRAMGER